MDQEISTDSGAARRHQQLTGAVKLALRDVRNQLSMLNHRVGARLRINDVDLDCLDLIARDGPISPSTLARQAGLHPATMTGILDRLERGGWIVRERAPSDRRAVVVRARTERSADVVRLYAGMNQSLNEICAGYDETQLETIADFLRRVSEAGHHATNDLTQE